MSSALIHYSNQDSDVVVIGAGLAGATAAAVLGRQGLRVTLVDPRTECPAVFKAEKIEPDQAEILRKFGLLEALLGRAGKIREIQSYYNGRVFGITRAEQYGLFYGDMVNGVRAQIPKSVQEKTERVTRISNSCDTQRVTLASGEELTCRLAILASGLSTELPASLGLKRIVVRRHHSAAVAFTIARTDGRAFEFDSVTYQSGSAAMGVDYLTLFPIGENMRANLFAFPAENDGWVRRFIEAPEHGLRMCFPKLGRAIGEFRIASKLETSLIHLYRTAGEPPQGVVLIGDAAQNACPSTGSGLSKVLTDVDVLCSKYVPEWMQTPGMGREKVSAFWNDGRKRATDEQSLRDAIYRRQARTDPTLKWKIHRARLELAMRFGRPGKAASAAPRQGEM